MRTEQKADDPSVNPYATFGHEQTGVAASRSDASLLYRLAMSVCWGALAFVAMYGLYVGIYLFLGNLWTDELPWMAGVAAAAVGIATWQAGVLRAFSGATVRWLPCWIISGITVPAAFAVGAFVTKSLAPPLLPPRLSEGPPDPTAWNLFVGASLATQLLICIALSVGCWFYGRRKRAEERASALE